MNIAIGTINKAKISAVQGAFTAAFPDEPLVLLPHDVDSGVSAMPLNNDETLRGAINRAKAVQLLEVGADYFIGLEGGVYDGPLGDMYLLGWVAIIKNGDLTIGKGHSSGVVLPKEIAYALRGGDELGPLMHQRTGSDIRHNIGTVGYLTGGLYPRNREFEDALKVALAPFVSRNYYS